MITIDGSMGEGGGQVLRSSLSLSAITGETIRIHNIRANRKRPGLMRQHLTAFLATQKICNGDVTGAEVGSDEISLKPGGIRAGAYRFSVGTAGSTSLVLQTVLPILLQADGPSTVVISGGTHNPSSPPFDFLDACYLPALRAIGHKITARLNSCGFYPAGGGEIEIDIEPAEATTAFVLKDRGEETSRSLEAVLSNLPGNIAERELAKAGPALNVPEEDRHIRTRHSAGPGNVLFARLEFENVTALLTQFGERNVSAEQVAVRLSKTANTLLTSNAAVTEHLADQLLLPMALAKGGSFSTLPPSRHTETNVEVISRFVGCQVAFTGAGSAYQCDVNV